MNYPLFITCYLTAVQRYDRIENFFFRSVNMRFAYSVFKRLIEHLKQMKIYKKDVAFSSVRTWIFRYIVPFAIFSILFNNSEIYSNTIEQDTKLFVWLLRRKEFKEDMKNLFFRIFKILFKYFKSRNYLLNEISLLIIDFFYSVGFIEI